LTGSGKQRILTRPADDPRELPIQKGTEMRKRSPAMIVAMAALSVALGGVGVAATGGNKRRET